MIKYSYFTKYLATSELDAELTALGEQGWKLVHIEKHKQSPYWFAIFIKEVAIFIKELKK